MKEYQLGAVEARFADLIWEHEPIASTRLCAMALEQLTWKKSTTYTVLKRLCDKGIFQNNEGIVTSLISKEAFICAQSQQFVEENFSGSLPAFLAAFTARKGLSEEEVAYLRGLIAQHEEG